MSSEWAERWNAARNAGRHRWAQFLVILGIRLVGGVLIGLLVGWFGFLFLMMGAGRTTGSRRNAQLFQNFKPSWVRVAGAAGAAVGGLASVWTIPRWKCPWYLGADREPWM
ncbi:MAG: hypothetical protein U1G08_16480 [Verrucomicrobiota bacterium]